MRQRTVWRCLLACPTYHRPVWTPGPKSRTSSEPRTQRLRGYSGKSATGKQWRDVRAWTPLRESCRAKCRERSVQGSIATAGHTYMRGKRTDVRSACNAPTNYWQRSGHTRGLAANEKTRARVITLAWGTGPAKMPFSRKAGASSNVGAQVRRLQCGHRASLLAPWPKPSRP